MSVTSKAAEAMIERAARGEPEPGIYVCLRCGRDDCRMYTVVLDEHEAIVEMGELNRLNRFDAREWTHSLKGILLCPCCSFPHLSNCPHQPLDPRCSVCDRSTLPKGTLPGGGPFVRCDGPESHPADRDEQADRLLERFR